MAAVSVNIAEAVKDMLVTADPAPGAEIERSYADWELELLDAETLRIDVVAASNKQTSTLGARGQMRFGVPVDIVVRQKFSASAQDADTGRVEIADVDALCLLVQTIHSLFTEERLTGFLSAAWQSTEILVCPLLNHLRTMRQFTGVVRVTFQANTAVA